MTNYESNTVRLNPVSLPQGQQSEHMVEFSLDGSFPLEIVRSLTSGRHDSPLGERSISSLDVYIRRTGSGYKLYGNDNFPVEFPSFETDVQPEARNGLFPDLVLQLKSSGKIWLKDKKITTHFKRYSGQIWHQVAVEDINGNRIEFERDRDGQLHTIKHPDGLRLEFKYNNQGFRTGYDLVAKTGVRQSIMKYRYDDKGRLTAAENKFGESWIYGYDKVGNRNVAKNMGGTQTRHVYDDENRVQSVEPEGNYKEGRFVYNPSHRHAKVYHGKGDEVFEVLYFDDKERHHMSALPDGSISYRHFDDFDQLIGETDANGNRTSYEYDPFGNMQSIKDAEGRETFMVWDDLGNLITHIDNEGNKTRYEYDDLGNLIGMTSPIGTKTAIQVNEKGLPEKILRDDGRMETRAYDERNRLITITDFGGAQTTFTYDDFNRPLTITDAANNTTTLHYDDEMRGRDFYAPSSVTRPDAVTTTREFNPTGTLKSLTDGEGRTTQYEYGAYNVLEGIVDPKGNKLKFEYNSQEQLTKVTNQTGLNWSFNRDNCGRVTTETDFDGRTLQYEYDPGGRVTKRTNPDKSTLGYEYDKSGRLLKLIATEPDGTERETTYAYDDNGALAKAENPDATIELERDAMGRITRETQNGIDILSAYDCCTNRIRREIKQGEADDQTLHMLYDPMGNIQQWELGGHKPLHFARNPLGQETERYSFEGFLVRQKWDQIGQLNAQQAGKGTFEKNALAGFDKHASREYAWSQAFDPVQIASSKWGEKNYQYDQNGQITKTAYSNSNDEVFRYNRDLNLAGSGEEKPNPLAEAAHQAMGTDGSDKFTNWQTSAAGVVRAARGPNGERIELEHDVCGRVTRRRITRKGFRPQEWRFEWNAMDQMISCTTPEGDKWHYAYDPFGRRVLKECTSLKVKTEFIWDGDVLAYEETNGARTDWFYEPSSFRPLAKSENGKLFYIVNDHLGTPKEAFSESGAMLWSVDHHIWGTVKSCWMSATLDPEPDPRGVYLGKGFQGEDVYSVRAGNTAMAYEASANPDALFIPIRFQGQYEDAETGLFYNRYRYYDAGVGSYCSPDPIGIMGGMRNHHYVKSTSRFYDPRGLADRSFYTVQGSTEFQAMCAGTYRPRTAANGSEYGVGVYTFDNEASAQAYQQRISGNNPNTQIVKLDTTDRKLSGLSRCCLNSMSDEAATAFQEANSRLYNPEALEPTSDWVTRGTQFGDQHFFKDGAWQNVFNVQGC